MSHGGDLGRGEPTLPSLPSLRLFLSLSLNVCRVPGVGDKRLILGFHLKKRQTLT